MGQDAKIRLAAKIMLAKFGKAAARVARLRARRSARHRDEEAVKAWTAVAKAASAAPSRRKSKIDVPVSDVRDGQGTKQEIAADQVEGEDGARLMRETTRRR